MRAPVWLGFLSVLSLSAGEKRGGFDAFEPRRKGIFLARAVADVCICTGFLCGAGAPAPKELEDFIREKPLGPTAFCAADWEEVDLVVLGLKTDTELPDR